LLGILYCFMGIKLANENYINPSIDIIKKKGVVSHALIIVSSSFCTYCFRVALIRVNECHLARHD